MDIQSKLVTCKICKEVKEFSCLSRFPNGVKKWTDEDGLICNGNTCGSCNRLRAKGVMKKVRKSRSTKK